MVAFVLFTIGMCSAHTPCRPSLVCPGDDWLVWGQSCYKDLRVDLNWSEAQQRCQEMGGQMASPDTKEELDFMVVLMGSNFWINCNDMDVEGRWVCENGGQYPTDAYKQHSDTSGVTLENCAAVDTDGLWVDLGCKERYELTVCKAKKQVHTELKSWRLLVSCLTGFTRLELAVDSLYECAVQCARHQPACRSFNLLHSPVLAGTATAALGNTKTCQLNTVTRSEVDRSHFVQTDTMCIYGEK